MYTYTYMSNGLNLLHLRKDVAEMVIVFYVSLIVPEDLTCVIKSGKTCVSKVIVFCVTPIVPESFMIVSSINVLVWLFQNVGGFGGRSYIYIYCIYSHIWLIFMVHIWYMSFQTSWTMILPKISPPQCLRSSNPRQPGPMRCLRIVHGTRPAHFASHLEDHPRTWIRG